MTTGLGTVAGGKGNCDNRSGYCGGRQWELGYQAREKGGGGTVERWGGGVAGER